MDKKQLYPYAKEVHEETDSKKIASYLSNQKEEWIAVNAIFDKKNELSKVVLIRLK